jgi:DNA-binding response OmpR family regulator
VRPLRILVVDDDPGIRAAMVRYLSKDGHEVVCAFDGPAALRQIDIGNPDVVLLDIGLGPPFDGVKVFRRLPRAIPVVLVSGLTPEEIRSRAMDSVNALAGVVSIIAKPVDFAELRRVLALIGGDPPTRLPDDDDDPTSPQ